MRISGPPSPYPAMPFPSLPSSLMAGPRAMRTTLAFCLDRAIFFLGKAWSVGASSMASIASTLAAAAGYLAAAAVPSSSATTSPLPLLSLFLSPLTDEMCRGRPRCSSTTKPGGTPMDMAGSVHSRGKGRLVCVYAYKVLDGFPKQVAGACSGLGDNQIRINIPASAIRKPPQEVYIAYHMPYTLGDYHMPF